VYRESSNVGGSIVQDDDNALLLDEALKSIDSLVPALSLSAPQLIPMQFSAVSISSSSSCSTCSCCSSCSSCSCCSSNSCMLW
jgi:hypothetical protein